MRGTGTFTANITDIHIQEEGITASIAGSTESMIILTMIGTLDGMIMDAIVGGIRENETDGMVTVSMVIDSIEIDTGHINIDKGTISTL